MKTIITEGGFEEAPSPLFYTGQVLYLDPWNNDNGNLLSFIAREIEEEKT